MFLDKNNYTDLEVLMHICYVMVIELHKKGGRQAEKQPVTNIGGNLKAKIWS